MNKMKPNSINRAAEGHQAQGKKVTVSGLFFLMILQTNCMNVLPGALSQSSEVWRCP